MTYDNLIELIRKRQSYLCIGLDTDVDKLPLHFEKSMASVIEFNKKIIDATRAYCVAYKPNTAFYERYGAAGWQALTETIAYIGDTHFIIADAKRGDIGNTATQYAKAFFETLRCDAITVAPYMGHDSIAPFVGHPDKWAIMLALTSNSGANDYQLTVNEHNQPLYEQVIVNTQTYSGPHNMMYVVGASKTQYLERVRELAPTHFLLIPGVGAQGGSLEEVSRLGLTPDALLLVNNTREILYASDAADYAEAAATKASTIQREMQLYLSLYSFKK